MLCKWMPILCVAVFASSVMAGDAPKEEVEVRIYDVAELTNSVADFPGPDPSLISYAQAAQVTPNQNNGGANAPPPRQPVPTCASLSDMIRQRVSPDQWDAALGTSIEEMGGKLVIAQYPSLHTSISHLLKSLSSSVKAQVVVRALLIPSAEIPDETFFDLNELNKTFGGNAAAQAISTPRMVCFNHQRAHIVSGTEINTVRSIDINGDTFDPAIGTLIDGMVFDVSPTLSDDHSSVDVDLRVTLNANVKRNPKVLGVAPTANLRAIDVLPQADSTTTNKDGSTSGRTVNQMLNSQYAIGMEVDTPSMDSAVVRTEVVIPSGKWILAGTMNNTDTKSAKKNLLLFVSAEAVESK